MHGVMMTPIFFGMTTARRIKITMPADLDAAIQAHKAAHFGSGERAYAAALRQLVRLGLQVVAQAEADEDAARERNRRALAAIHSPVLATLYREEAGS